MKNSIKKLIAVSSVVPFVMAASLAFAQPVNNGPSNGHENHNQPQQQQQVKKHEPQKHQPNKVAKKSNTAKRYVYIKKNGKTVKVDCWKNANKNLRVCKVK